MRARDLGRDDVCVVGVVCVKGGLPGLVDIYRVWALAMQDVPDEGICGR